MDFRIRQLNCFLTLSDLLSFGDTARALCMSQSNVTFQIKSLEEAFGVRLFERDRKRVRLTDAGVEFRGHAQNIIDLVDSAYHSMGGAQRRPKLRVSCGPVGQFLLLPAVIRALVMQYPEFELEVSDLTPHQQITQLVEGSVDALLMVKKLPLPGLRFDPIRADPLVAVVSRRSPLADLPRISVQHLRDIPLIASRLEDCRFHQPYLLDLLAPFGIQPRMVESPHSWSVQVAYAAAGAGIAIATAPMAACSSPDVVFLPFEEPLPHLQLCIAAREIGERPAMNIFRKVVIECAATICPEPLLSKVHELTSHQAFLH